MAELIRDRSATLIQHLHRLDPSDHSNILLEVLQLFACVDVTLSSKVTDWLRPAFGWSVSKSMVESAMNKMECPLKFIICDDGRPALACVPITSETDTANGVAENDTHDSESVTLDVVQVPFTSPDGTDQGLIIAVLHEGDLVKLKCLSSIVWQVYALRPSEGKIILSLHMRTDNYGFKSTTGKKSRDFQQLETKKCRPSDFMGAIIWKELSAVIDDDCLESPAEDAIQQQRQQYESDTEHISEDIGGDGKEKSVSCIFQMPAPQWKSVLKRMIAIVDNCKQLQEEREKAKRSKECFSSSNRNRSISNSNSSRNLISDNSSRRSMSTFSTESKAVLRREESPPMLHNFVSDGYHAQAQEWVIREQDIQRGRRLLWIGDPFSCCLASCRERWILICRALKTICRGDEDILNDFYRWTHSAGEEGRMRAKDCQAMWTSLRPLTTSDLPCVVQARVYARACLNTRQAETEAEIGGSGESKRYEEIDMTSLPFKNIEAACQKDPTVRHFIESARGVLSGRSLYFLSSVHDPGSPAPQYPPGSLMVPAVVYESALTVDAAHQGQGSDVDFELKNPEGRTQHVCLTDVVASISPGDVILLPITPHYSYPESWTINASDTQYSDDEARRGRKSTWHRVVAVDLLYARLRVSPCPSPPDCWVKHVTLTSVWAPVSSLWAVPVCQMLPLTNPECAGRTVRYHVYVAPIPSLSASFAALSSIPHIRRCEEKKDTCDQKLPSFRSKLNKKIN
jgi:hypothetical protein